MHAANIRGRAVCLPRSSVFGVLADGEAIQKQKREEVCKHLNLVNLDERYSCDGLTLIPSDASLFMSSPLCGDVLRY